ncbi:MAG TPA: phosphotransferase [Bacilli bacterium]|nr:phosphotransferase [Bacilli bacterium]
MDKLFPSEIDQIVTGISYTIDDIGCSGDKVFLFEKKYVLKISNNKERLKNEKMKIDWIASYIPSSKSVAFYEDEMNGYYLRTYLDGDSLIHKRFLSHPIKLIEILRQAVLLLRGLDDKECPFQSIDNKGDAFIHGDLCLPNILVDENDDIIGFIDLDNSGKGDPWYDYSWLLWSLEFNLKTDRYNHKLLQALGISFRKEKYEQYIPFEYISDLNRNK